jgi:predicted PurR-regulated permease PerM
MSLKAFVVLVIFPVIISAFSLLSDNLAEDIKQYFTALNKIIDIEAQAIISFDSAASKNFLRDASLYALLQYRVIPRYKKFLEELAKITSDNQEIAALHEEYLYGVKVNYGAMKKLLLAMNKQDHSLVNEANADFECAAAIIDLYNKKITALEKKAVEE